jgi:hypothetical protein
LTRDDKLRLAAFASGLDRLVPQIAQAMAQVDTQEDYDRLAKLLRPAESFLLETGPILSRVRAGASEPDEPCERFMRELPRRLRMIRTAQAVMPPLLPVAEEAT